MLRPLRIELAGGLYHVTSRGDRREAIYGDDQDRIDWLGVLGDVCSRFNWRCHAWCQMTNHYHIVVETAEANLSQGMRQLNGVYTQAINHHHGLVGHLFQGRFKAILVERDAYLRRTGSENGVRERGQERGQRTGSGLDLFPSGVNGKKRRSGGGSRRRVTEEGQVLPFAFLSGAGSKGNKGLGSITGRFQV